LVGALFGVGDAVNNHDADFAPDFGIALAFSVHTEFFSLQIELLRIVPAPHWSVRLRRCRAATTLA
jgi:hypothetical protein